ncbi:hypothetical protein Nepgr_010622 [Nepenthes gracilis]|uniref:Major facilitator superfamily (MFS) profile domain-containing protein n=1 Tax=Nepenthes gracilis TaxID=150966 RepID=A0AAD3SD05_NEPGR|nr:hypothetical protein Nepgr_010622 [Nepenthes gracilis]
MGEPIDEAKDDKPIGIKVIEYIKNATLSYTTFQTIVLLVTFFSYTTYHLARKTTSVIKSALDPSSDVGSKLVPFQYNYLHKPIGNRNSMDSTTSGWAPFNGSDGTELLGYLDVAFLSFYALGQYFSGQLGDRTNLRVLLTVGMLGTGLFTASFGFGYWLNIHNFYYYLVVQMLAGLFQSTGWPSVVAVVGNWFGKSKRGLIMGVWNAHTSVGNITGSLIASNLLQFGWGWSLLVPGLIIAFMGIVVFLLLPVSPSSVGVHGDDDEDNSKFSEKETWTEPLVGVETGVETDVGERAVGFIEAWKIPGVAIYAFCLFFAKLVAYTFLYWLPFYISYTEIGGEYLSSETSGNLSTLFDIGGVVGGILAGYISDHLNARAITAASFAYASIPALFLYRSYGYINIYVNAILMFIAGVFVNGPYALITTAVSADLGTHSSLRGHSRALATVTAIIDGTGSIGAAIGPLLTSYISATSWTAVFTMLMASAFVAGLLLTKLVVAEITAKIDLSRMLRTTDTAVPV